MDYYTIFDAKTAQSIIKKSRFIAKIEHIESAAEAQEKLNDLRSENWKANHICYAYIVGKRSEEKKFSDAGEPAGTAGKPILSVLEANKFTDVLASVVRYFGGVKLGASGLTRAYSQVTADCAMLCEKVRMVECITMSICVDYADYSRAMNPIYGFAVAEPQSLFEEKTTIIALIPAREEKAFLAALREATGGRFDSLCLGTGYVKDTKKNA